MTEFTLWRFEQPYFLLLALLLPIALLWWRKRRPPTARMRYGSVARLAERPSSWRVALQPTLPILRAIAYLAFVVALAGPQSGRGKTRLSGEGIDIMLTLDISGSMRLTDDPKGKKPNRLEEAKAVLQDFVQGRQSDPIGLVVFSGISYTVCPMTLDYLILDPFIESIQLDNESTSTAIGSALATAVNRLRDSDSPSKVIILITDGDNNAGRIDPSTAAGLAKAMGMKVYTVGVGSPEGGYLVRPGFIFGSRVQRVESNLNEPMLQEIAQVTGGQYFRASAPGSLSKIFQTIDQLEKREYEVDTFTRYEAHFGALIALGLALFALEWLLGATWLRKLP